MQDQCGEEGYSPPLPKAMSGFQNSEILNVMRMSAYAQTIQAYSSIEGKDGWEAECANLERICDRLVKQIEL